MNLRLQILFLALVGVVAGSGAVFGQGKNISQTDYWRETYAAYSLSRKSFPRIQQETYESYTDGKITYSQKKKFEYQAANNFRLITETIKDGKKSKSEMIQVGSSRYCREGSGEWKNSGCYLNPPAPLGDAKVSTFIVQKNRDGVTYLRTATYFPQVNGQEGPIEFITEDTLKLNKDLTVSERKITKSVRETKALARRETERYEYPVKLEPIEAPTN